MLMSVRQRTKHTEHGTGRRRASVAMALLPSGTASLFRPFRALRRQVLLIALAPVGEPFRETSGVYVPGRTDELIRVADREPSASLFPCRAHVCFPLNDLIEVAKTF